MTKVAVLVDGSGEEQALNELIPRINKKLSFDQRILKAAYVDIQHKAAAAQIVRKATNRVTHMSNRADKVIILVDFEDRTDCVSSWANELKNAFHSRGMNKVEVVIKNRTFEKWLISDPDNIHSRKGYSVSAAKR